MKIVFQVSGGIGKSVAATAVCRAIKRAYPKAELIVLSGYTDVFAPNPNVSMSLGFNNLNYFYQQHVQGQLVFTTPSPPPKIGVLRIDMLSFASGVYMVEPSDGDGVRSVVKGVGASVLMS